jgi:hypothetical protein
MKHEIREAMRGIYEVLDTLPPGPLRDQVEDDLANFKERLMALPARVAAHAPFPDADEFRNVIERELIVAFSDVLKWMV